MEKCRPFGVTVPPSRWCGVRACELRNSPCGLLSERATSFSYFEAVCTGGMIEPNSRLHCSSLSGSAPAPVTVSGRPHGARDRDALTEQGAAIDQTVTRHKIGRGSTPSAMGCAHDALLTERR